MSSSPPPPPHTHPLLLLVTGPAGCGKTTTARHLATAFSIPYLEGDEFHPAANVAKMAAGTPLSDEDRWGWLERVRDAAVGVLRGGEAEKKEGEAEGDGVVDPATQSTAKQSAGARSPPSPSSASSRPKAADVTPPPRAVVVTCSALKRTYRDVLRAVPDDAEEPEPGQEDNKEEEDEEEERKSEKKKNKKIEVRFIFLALSEEVLYKRVRERVGHYMKESMVKSQLEVLEAPDEGERARDVAVVDAEGEREVVAGVVEGVVRGWIG